MAVINNANEILHRIRAKLYPNYLHTVKGAYIARVDDCQKAKPFGLGVCA